MAIKKRLGEMLVDAGIIDDQQLHAALRHQRQWGGRLGAILVELKLASEEAIVDALALKFGFEIARLDRIEPYAFEQARALVPHDYAVRHRIFPMAADTGVLVVAMSDPTNLALTDELAFKTGRRVKVCIAGDNAIGAAIRAHFGEDAAGQREAIALEPDDDGTMEAVFDPIGATSSEQLSQFFEQPSAPAAPAPVRPAPAATRPAQAAARPVQPAAAPPAAQPRAPAQAVAPPPAAQPRTRSPAELQLEDQPTGSLPLEEVSGELLVEELQPEPMEAEAAAAAPAAPAEEPYAQGAEAWAEPYGGAAAGEAQAGVEGEAYAAQAGEGAPPRELTEQEVEILAAIDRLARGDEATPSAIRPAQLLAAVIRLMVRKQWITEQELLDELLHG